MNNILTRLYMRFLIWKELRQMVKEKEITSNFRISYDKNKKSFGVDVEPIGKVDKIDYFDGEKIEEEPINEE